MKKEIEHGADSTEQESVEGRLPLVDPMYIKALRFGGYLMISAGPMFEGFVESSSTVGRPHGACQHEHAVNDK